MSDGGERAGAEPATEPVLVLASASPQRSAILARIGVTFDVRPADVEEQEEGVPVEVAAHNALQKARAIARAPGPDGSPVELPVLGVDTVVALGGRIHGKPADEEEARQTLGALSGRTHSVVSGLALIGTDGHEHIETATTRVTFRELDSRIVDWSIASGEWRGRAGGYAIQESGGALVRAIDGDYFNVVGLPVALLLDIWPALLGG